MSYLRVSFSAFEAPAALDAPDAKTTGRVALDSKPFDTVRPAAQVWRWPTAPVYISAPERPRRILPYVAASASALVLVALGLVWAL